MLMRSLINGALQNELNVTAVIMTQISLKAGLNKWSKKGGGEVHSDMNQLHMRYMFILIHMKDLTKEQSNTTLESHILLKENRDGTVNIRAVACGNNQIEYTSKEGAISPTFATKSVLLTYIVYTEEHKYVATVEIPNVFIQTCIRDEKDMTILILEEY